MDQPRTLLSLVSTGTTAKASSILQRNAKQYGPLNALDTKNSSSCWNSEGTAETKGQGCWFIVDFCRPVMPDELRIQFQAGFCAETCSVYIKNEQDEWILVDDTIEFDDVHDLQTRSLRESSKTTRTIKLDFDDPTDFYGRITIYRLEVWGEKSRNEINSHDLPWLGDAK